MSKESVLTALTALCINITEDEVDAMGEASLEFGKGVCKRIEQHILAELDAITGTTKEDLSNRLNVECILECFREDFINI